MSTGTITEAKLAPEEDRIFPGRKGDLHRWYVLIDAEGKTIKTAILRQPTSPDPTGEPAETYESNGTVRWRVAQQGGGGKGGGRSPADTKAIQRQHSQEMALRAIAVGNQIGVTTTQGPIGGAEFRARIEAWTDWFERNITGEKQPE